VSSLFGNFLKYFFTLVQSIDRALDGVLDPARACTRVATRRSSSARIDTTRGRCYIFSRARFTRATGKEST